MEETEIQDPHLAPNAAALVIKEVDGNVTAAVFYGPEIKKDSVAYQVIEQLLGAVVGSAQGAATLVEDTTGSLAIDAGANQEG